MATLQRTKLNRRPGERKDQTPNAEAYRDRLAITHGSVVVIHRVPADAAKVEHAD